MNTLINRLISDYLMPSRLGIYEDFITFALDSGYSQISIRSFIEHLDHADHMNRKLIIHRHDIDTDLRTARKIFDLEKRHSIQSSFYFRLAKLDFGFMREIEEYGSEASYHYEEVASFAKRQHLNCPQEIRKLFPDIQEEFIVNLRRIEQKLGRKLISVASHGDFANRRLKMANHEILNDRHFRARCGIRCDSYDLDLLNHFDAYLSDRPYPDYFFPCSPFAAIGRHNRICLLTHPRHWETNWLENTQDNLFRLIEGIKWAVCQSPHAKDNRPGPNMSEKPPASGDFIQSAGKHIAKQPNGSE